MSCALPAGETISEEYKLEYGTDKIEMHKGAVGPGDRVLVVDDLIATGGTLGAGIRLIGEGRQGSKMDVASAPHLSPNIFGMKAMSILWAGCCVGRACGSQRGGVRMRH